MWQELRRDSPGGAPIGFGSPPQCEVCAGLEEQLSKLRNALSRQREDHCRKLAAARAQQYPERIKHQAEARELHDQLTEFLALVEG